MKKLGLLLCLFVVTLGVKAAATDAKIVIDDFTIEPGGTAVLNVKLQNVGNDDIVGFNFTMTLPKGMVFDSYIKKGNKAYYVSNLTDEDLQRWDDLYTQHTLSYNAQNTDDDVMKFLIYSNANKPFYSIGVCGGNEIIFTIQVKAAENMAPGQYSASVSDIKLSFFPDTSKDFKPTDFEVGCTVAAAETTISYELKTEYGTLILPFDAVLPAGLQANSCAAVNDNVLVLSAATSLVANTPYIMSGTLGTYTFTGTPVSTENPLIDGLLIGVLKDTAAPAGSFVLQNKSEGLGFYKVGSTIPTVKANRCYLSSEAAQALVVRFGGTTRIDNVEAEEHAAVFDILGRKVEGPLQKGIYIKNGKKVYVK